MHGLTENRGGEVREQSHVTYQCEETFLRPKHKVKKALDPKIDLTFPFRIDSNRTMLERCFS